MTVPTETTRSTYTGNGATTAFSTGFYFQSSDQVRVRVTPSGGVESIKVEGVDYTVTNPTLGSGAAGTVTFTAAPALNAAVVIERVVDLVQETSLRTVGTFSPAVHEDKFDELTFQIQQVARDLDDVVLGSSSANIAAGSGLTSTGTGPVTLHVGAGAGIVVNPDDVSVAYGDETVMSDASASPAAPGLLDLAARIDHKHDVVTGAPGAIAIGDTTSSGVSTGLSRSDHRHALPAPAAPADVTKAAASAGVATTVARADHKHDVTTAVAVALTDSTNAEGVATSLARSDHTHSHGNRGGGTLHAEANGGAAGFMPAAHWSILNAALAAKTHVHAYQNATQSMPSGVGGATCIFDTQDYDANGEYDPVTGIYTAKDAGYILVTAGFTLASAAWLTTSTNGFLLMKNDATTPVVEAVAGDPFDAAITRVSQFRLSKVVKVAIGDTLQMKLTHNQGAAVNSGGSRHTCFVTFDRIL